MSQEVDDNDELDPGQKKRLSSREKKKNAKLFIFFSYLVFLSNRLFSFNNSGGSCSSGRHFIYACTSVFSWREKNKREN